MPTTSQTKMFLTVTFGYLLAKVCLSDCDENTIISKYYIIHRYAEQIYSDLELREIFTSEEFCALLLETGYRKAYSTVTLNDLEELRLTLRQYHTMIFADKWSLTRLWTVIENTVSWT